MEPRGCHRSQQPITERCQSERQLVDATANQLVAEGRVKEKGQEKEEEEEKKERKRNEKRNGNQQSEDI